MPAVARPQTVALPFAVAALGIIAFSTMDALMRGSTQAMGAYNAVLWRMLIAVPIGGAAYWLSRAPRPSREAMRLHIIRGVVGTAMAVTFFWGLARMAMAEAIALSFIAPVMVLYLAALLLGEKIGRGAIIAAVLGFGGVLLIASAKLGAEGPERDPLAVLAILLSAALYAYNIVLMRQQALVASAFEIPFFQSLVVVACLALFAPWHAALPPSGQWPALAAAGVLGTLALLLLAWAYRRAEAQILATAEYTALIWAMLFDALLFNEPILITTVAGALLIVAGCLIAARPGRAPLSPSEAPL